MIIKNEELLPLLQKAGDLVKEVQEINKKISDLDEERNAKAIAHQKNKELILPLIKQYEEGLGEFEDIVGVEIVLDEEKKPTDEIEIKVVNRLEEWKRLFAEEKAKRNAPVEVEEKKEEVKE